MEVCLKSEARGDYAIKSKTIEQFISINFHN